MVCFCRTPLTGGANCTELSSTSLTISGNDFGTDVYAVEPSKATLLTAAGRIYATLDSGRNWQQYFVIQDEPEQTFMARVRMLQNKNLWVLGSTDSREGMWTTIIKQQDRHSTRFRVDGVRIRDLVFVSENEIIACGSIPTSDPALFGSRTGVVLYSPDEGQSWVKMYSDAEGRPLNAIAIDGDKVWIVGDDGLLLQVTPR